MKKTKMLKKNYEFKQVLSKGNYYSGTCLEAFIRPNHKKDLNFLGIAIGVKIAKAVVRNKIKRLIRENYRKVEYLVKPGISIVFLWKKRVGTEKATFENIEKDMKKIFDKAKVLEENI